MTETALVPDYFPSFRCKIGACRHSCCEGWTISVTMKDYFKLLSVPCSEELRRRIDTALHLYDYPTETKYAQISPRYDGNCGMRLPDGRCGLHAELGEEALSKVCRLYPRGIRTDGAFEASCANSCEAVLELLSHHKEPMRFITMPLELEAPAGPRNAEDSEEKQQMRLRFIRIMQNRQQPLSARLFTLRQALCESVRSVCDPVRSEGAHCQDDEQHAWGSSRPECTAHSRAQLLRALKERAVRTTSSTHGGGLAQAC